MELDFEDEQVFLLHDEAEQRLFAPTKSNIDSLIESVLGRTSKIMVDVKGGNNLLYLPLDRLVRTDQEGATLGSRPGQSALPQEQNIRRPDDSQLGRRTR